MDCANLILTLHLLYMRIIQGITSVLPTDFDTRPNGCFYKYIEDNCRENTDTIVS